MIVDIIIIAILALCVIFGYKRGLIGVAFKFLSLIIAIVLALLLYKPVANFVINNTGIDEEIEKTIAKNIDFSKYENKTEKEIIEESNMPQVVVNQIKKSIDTTIDTAKESVEKTVTRQLSNSIINIAILIILFIVIKIILLVINLVGDVISKLPLIKQFNKLGGTIYGILEGAIIVYGILALILIVTPMTQSTGLLEVINSSTLGNMLYNNNILLKFFG